MIVVTLRIPSTLRGRQINALTLEAQPEYADTADETTLTRRFYFTATGDYSGGGGMDLGVELSGEEDTQPPECHVAKQSESTAAEAGKEMTNAAQQCVGFEGQQCANKMWTARVYFQV